MQYLINLNSFCHYPSHRQWPTSVGHLKDCDITAHPLRRMDLRYLRLVMQSSLQVMCMLTNVSCISLQPTYSGFFLHIIIPCLLHAKSEITGYTLIIIAWVHDTTDDVYVGLVITQSLAVSSHSFMYWFTRSGESCCTQWLLLGMCLCVVCVCVCVYHMSNTSCA